MSGLGEVSRKLVGVFAADVEGCMGAFSHWHPLPTELICQVKLSQQKTRPRRSRRVVGLLSALVFRLRAALRFSVNKANSGTRF